MDIRQNGEIDSGSIITHRLHPAPAALGTFRRKEGHCVKVVVKPWH